MDTQLDPPMAYLADAVANHAYRRHGKIKSARTTDGFRCKTCHAYVHTIPLLAGVQNRNHCPYCLWSRHMDLTHAGDRLSACKGNMQPIGLTLKRSRDKYGYQRQGELMLIHRCRECGGISINRIAADDYVDELASVLQVSTKLDSHTLTQLKDAGICLLQPGEAKLVEGQLYGIYQL